MEKYYSTQQIAEMCHVTRGSVIRWIREGKLQAAMTAGGHSRVAAGEIAKLLASLRMPVPAELIEVSAKSPNRLSKVLIVDDEPSICDLLELFFEQFFPGVEVRVARNGFDAGMLAGSFSPDLIMLDLKMPGMDGFEVCQKIRSTSELKHAKILAMTGIDEDGIKKKFFNLGADAHIKKPFNLKELNAEISALYGTRPEEGESHAA